MKKIFLSILALSLFSCDVEQLDSSISTGDNGNGSNPTSGDYFPMALNNTWAYNEGTANSEMKITGTATFNNKSYFKIENSSFLPDATNPEANYQYIRKENSKYYTYNEGSVIILDNIPANFKLSEDIIILNDALPVSGNWTQNIMVIGSYTYDNQTITMNLPLKVEGKILQKITTFSINGTNYTDVIKVELKTTVGVGVDLETSIGEIYFAKNIGVIKSNSIDEDGNSITSNLISYSLN